MNKIIVIGIVLVLVLIAVFVFVRSGQKVDESKLTSNSKISTMMLSSEAFSDNSEIPVKYSCDGQKINPPLKISNAPANAQSLALIIEDPDAPGGTFIHWTMWNIKPNATFIAEGAVPEGAVQGLNSADKVGYTPMCPPSGIHHYHFKVFALGTTLNLASGSKFADVVKAMEGHIIDQASLVGLYKRQ